MGPSVEGPIFFIVMNKSIKYVHFLVRNYIFRIKPITILLFSKISKQIVCADYKPFLLRINL